jgi:hypothetical protein
MLHTLEDMTEQSSARDSSALVDDLDREIVRQAVAKAVPTKPATLAAVRDLGTIPIWHPTKPDVCDVLDCSRSLGYAMSRRGELPTIRLGRKIVVSVPALIAMLEQTPASTAH